mmetsp:Transcript_138576/g.430986  ORF Transcript_138576/g.430986 Transcript_138576/m.430986 type:complete len:237 (-) Transcript_138576:693-1403(-)
MRPRPCTRSKRKSILKRHQTPAIGILGLPGTRKRLTTSSSTLPGSRTGARRYPTWSPSSSATSSGVTSARTWPPASSLPPSAWSWGTSSGTATPGRTSASRVGSSRTCTSTCAYGRTCRAFGASLSTPTWATVGSAWVQAPLHAASLDCSSPRRRGTASWGQSSVLGNCTRRWDGTWAMLGSRRSGTRPNSPGSWPRISTPDGWSGSSTAPWSSAPGRSAIGRSWRARQTLACARH